MSHFAQDYIGIPWKAYGRTPKGFDCWGLVVHVLREHFGVYVEDGITANGSRAVERVRAFIEHRDTKMADWCVVDYPCDGDIVVMCNRNLVPGHCGVYLEAMGGGVLHCEEGIGCIFESVSDIRWPNLIFYRRPQ